MIHLWKIYKDVVTGFEWTATAITKYLTWCDRVMLTPLIKEWEIKESATFDVNSIELVSEWCYQFFNKEEVNPKKKVWWPEKNKSKRIN